MIYGGKGRDLSLIVEITWNPYIAFDSFINPRPISCILRNRIIDFVEASSEFIVGI
jgi:hypothetical protein